MKRLIVAAAVLAVGVSIAITSVGGAQQTGERTFKLVEKGGAFKFVDNPPRQTRRNQPPSPGDFFEFSRKLYDESGASVGLILAHCIIAPGAGVNLDCQGNAKLKDGRLAISAVAGSSRTTVIAITGGTGAYEGASGSIVAVDRTTADNSPSDLTVHLLG
jgi:hypothetical protein